jgi:hypothetical protein
MRLKLKPEYLEFSIGGGKTIKRKLKNIDPSEFEKLYNLGYKEFFEEVDTKPSKKQKEVLEPLKIDNKIDFNIEDDTDK